MFASFLGDAKWHLSASSDPNQSPFSSVALSPFERENAECEGGGGGGRGWLSDGAREAPPTDLCPKSESSKWQKTKKNEKSSLKINDGPTLKRSGKVVRGFPIVKGIWFQYRDLLFRNCSSTSKIAHVRFYNPVTCSMCFRWRRCPRSKSFENGYREFMSRSLSLRKPQRRSLYLLVLGRSVFEESSGSWANP